MTLFDFSGASEITWYKGDEIIKETFEDFKFEHDGDFHRLTIAEVFPEDSGLYKAEASNATGTTSSQFTLLVNGMYVCPFDRYGALKCYFTSTI